MSLQKDSVLKHGCLSPGISDISGVCWSIYGFSGRKKELWIFQLFGLTGRNILKCYSFKIFSVFNHSTFFSPHQNDQSHLPNQSSYADILWKHPTKKSNTASKWSAIRKRRLRLYGSRRRIQSRLTDSSNLEGAALGFCASCQFDSMQTDGNVAWSTWRIPQGHF